MKRLVLLAIICLHNVVFAQKKSKVLVTINDEKITVANFKRVYEKNLDAIDNDEAKDVEKNLDLFINYKLKVNEAYAMQLDTATSYQQEMEMYKNQLAAPYLQDTAYINKLVKDAYYRTKNEVKAKHILIATPKIPSPKDTLLAFEKISKIRARILAGESFEKVAEETSDDPSARNNPKTGRKGNQGNLGYFSAFRMVYPFEDAAYNTKVGEVSKPFRTQFGYHILKVDAIRPSKGEVEVAHILLNDKSEKGKKLIDSIYTKLQKDEQFKTLARKYSNDTGTKSKGGQLRRFGAGVMFKEFEDVAFSLKKEGDYSKPFKTMYGWHIVQLLQKFPIQSFEEMEGELKNRVKSSSRAQLSQQAVIDKLKKKYTITENKEALQLLEDENVRKMSADSLKGTLFTVNDKAISKTAFINFIKNKNNSPIFELYKEFKDQEVLTYYKDNLEKTAPEFAYTLQEYKDGLLLFELMQQKIWEASSKDTLGLKNYYTKNISKYNAKEFTKVKGEVMNDYQNYLEKNWIADLRRKSVIQVNKRQLKKLIKFYNK